MNAPNSQADGARALRFGVFEIDLTSGELTKRGAKVRLHDRPFQVLAALVEHPGDLVSHCSLEFFGTNLSLARLFRKTSALPNSSVS